MSNEYGLKAISMSPEARKAAYAQEIGLYRKALVNWQGMTWVKGAISTALIAATASILMDDSRPDYLALLMGGVAAYTSISTVKGVRKILSLSRKKSELELKLSELEDDL